MPFQLRVAAVAVFSCALVSGVRAAPTVVGPTVVGPTAAELKLGPDDLRIEQLSDGGYHLYVRAKRGLGSILLTESTRDPAFKTDSYAFRALERNPVNGGEMRLLAGQTAPTVSKLNFLVDSTPEPDASFGRAFHIFIPWVVAWGYPWSRSGEEFIHDGSFINIRAFSKAYADYSGSFADNPYLIRVTQKPPIASPPAASAVPAAPQAPTAAPAQPAVQAKPAAEAAPETLLPVAKVSYKPDLYFPETISAFERLVDASGGQLRFASTDQDIVGQIGALLDGRKGASLDSRVLSRHDEYDD